MPEVISDTKQTAPQEERDPGFGQDLTEAVITDAAIDLGLDALGMESMSRFVPFGNILGSLAIAA